ncbi:MAG: hypothetical protein DGJ47_000571 [Rickettsiaceae bacterium]
MKQKIYQGSSKTLYQSEREDAFIMSFEDTMRIDGKTYSIPGKGVINNSISSHLMQKLGLIGIDNHLIEKSNMKRQLIQCVEIYPVQIHLSTIANGRYIKEFGMEEGFVFDSPILDWRVKNNKLNYPMVNEQQIVQFGWMSRYELKQLTQTAIRVHDYLAGYFSAIGLRMIDIKLEFGRIFNGEDFVPILIDEVSPDTCKLWDIDSNEKLCYELLNEGKEDKIIPAYQEVLRRITK